MKNKYILLQEDYKYFGEVVDKVMTYLAKNP